ncbi:MAG: N-acetylmuramoyl-L-alanine amidase [Clostridia bacterium]|nr:N-acetylmuramoyl-L-alanine amidase [Clostridia bacterium]
MKRVKTRKRNLKITNPIAMALFIAGILLLIGVIAVIITIAVGYGGDMVTRVQDELQGGLDEIDKQATATFTPVPTEAPTFTPEPIETPEVGTPAPTATPTPEPIGNIADTPAPTPDTSSPLYGVVVGLNPGRDKSSDYPEECAFNLEFCQSLKTYLEQRGATVVLARTDNDSRVKDATRGKIFQSEGCTLAVEIFCNHMGKNSKQGCYVRYGGSKEFAQELADAYKAVTGIPFQSNHSSGIYKKTEDVIHNSGKNCQCVRLVLGNWDNDKDRSIFMDASMQPKIFEAIYNVLCGRVKK